MRIFKVIVSQLICLIVIKIYRRENNFFLNSIFYFFLSANIFFHSLDRFLPFLRQPCKCFSSMISRGIQTSFHCLLSSCSKNLFHSLRRNQRNISLFPSLLNFFRLPFTSLPNFFPCNRCQDIFAIFLQAPPIRLFTNKPHHRFPFHFPLPISPFLPSYSPLPYLHSLDFYHKRRSMIS